MTDNFGKYQPHFDNTKAKRFREITEQMADLYERKNKDYGDSFNNSLDEFGVIAGVVRLSDKMNRIKALTKNGEQLVLDESIKDTLQDLANYSIMTMMWLEEKQTDENVWSTLKQIEKSGGNRNESK